MIERISCEQTEKYKAIEGAIHINRYMLAKNLCEGKKVLDVACGVGYGSYLMSQWGAKNVTGIDISKEAIQQAKEIFKEDNIDFRCDTVECLKDFPDNYFDLAISLETIEHLDNPIEFLKEVRRVVKFTGTIIVSCPNDHWYYPIEEQYNPYHKRKYTAEEFKKMTTQVLGSYSDFLYGVPAQGFVNVSAKENAPETIDPQLYMFNYKSNVESLFLPEDQLITDKNCSYFVGIWGLNKRNAVENAVVFPCGMDWNERNYENLKQTITGITLDKEKYQLLYENAILENKLMKKSIQECEMARELYNSRGFKVLKIWYKIKKLIVGK